jgi:hypothetical protein
MNNQERAYQLLGILRSYAPTSVEQARCTEHHNAFWEADPSGDLAVRELAHDLYLGTKKGFWPWHYQPIDPNPGPHRPVR